MAPVDRFAQCMAGNEDPTNWCGEPTQDLLVLTCGTHRRVVSTCSLHSLAATEITEPGGIASCELCEDMTGLARPMWIESVDPYSLDHPALVDFARNERDLNSL